METTTQRAARLLTMSNAQLIMHAQDLTKQRDESLAALYLALPFVEDCELDKGYKDGVAKKATATIRAAIASAEGVTP